MKPETNPKTLTINDPVFNQPVTLVINEKAESALYALLGDFDRETRPKGDLFKLILLMEKLTAAVYAFFEESGKLPVEITDEERRSLQTLLYVHDFFNFLEFSS